MPSRLAIQPGQKVAAGEEIGYDELRGFSLSGHAAGQEYKTKSATYKAMKTRLDHSYSFNLQRCSYAIPVMPGMFHTHQTDNAFYPLTPIHRFS